MGSASVKPSKNSAKITSDQVRSMSPKQSIPSGNPNKNRGRKEVFTRPTTSKSIISNGHLDESAPPLGPTLVEDLEWTDEKTDTSVSNVESEPARIVQKIDPGPPIGSAPVSRSRTIRTRVVKSLRSTGSYDMVTAPSDGQSSKVEKEELQDVMAWIFQPENGESTKRTLTRPRYRSTNRPVGVYEHESASRYP